MYIISWICCLVNSYRDGKYFKEYFQIRFKCCRLKLMDYLTYLCVKQLFNTSNLWTMFLLQFPDSLWGIRDLKDSQRKYKS